MMENVMVTGASSGLGQALAKAFKKRGCQVIGTGARPLQDRDLALRGIDTYIQTDFCEPEVACAAVMQGLRGKGIAKLDCLIHCAATGYYGDFAEQSATSIAAICNVNLMTPILLTKALLPYLQQSRIVFVSSVVAGFPMPDCMIYAATKSALEAFASNLKIELACYADVSLCQLGAMRTPMHQRVGFQVDPKRSARFADPTLVAAKIEQALCRQRPFRPARKDRLLIHAAAAWRMARLIAGIAPRIIPRQRIKAGQKVAITGAVQGIGLALAKAFAHKQCALVLIDRDRGGLQRTKRLVAEITRGEISTFDCDLSAAHALQALNRDLGTLSGGIDLFIHNAGVNHAGIFALQKDAPLLQTLQVNLFAPLLMTHALINGGRINRGGVVVFVSSLSHYVGYPGSSVYAATKDGLQSFAASLGRMPRGPHTATLFPGPTDTDQARANAPLGGVESRSEHRMDPSRVALEVVRALTHHRRVIIPGFANRVMAICGVLFPGMMRRAVASLLFKKMILELLHEQIRAPQQNGPDIGPNQREN